MRYLGLVGLYWKEAGQGSLKSGIAYSTQPTDIPVGSLASERDASRNVENIYELVRVSGTCTMGALLYQTGTNNAYVVCTGTGAGKPYAISMDAPTASGTWQWAQKFGYNTAVQVTNTFGGSAAGSGILYGGESAAQNHSAFITGTYSGAGGSIIGRSLTETTGSTTIGFIELL